MTRNTQICDPLDMCVEEQGKLWNYQSWKNGSHLKVSLTIKQKVERIISWMPVWKKCFEFYLISLVNVFQLRNDEYSTNHIIPNWCKFPQLSQYSYIDIMHKWNWKYLMSDILNEFQNKFQTCLCQENQLQNILSLGSLGLVSGWRRGIHITRKWFGQQNPQSSFSLHILHFFSTGNSTQHILYCKHCSLLPEWALTHVRGREV